MTPLRQKIGIIGGGQLGKMMILEAKKLNFHITVLDPAPNCPCHRMADEHIAAGFNDEAAYAALADKCDVITYEFEHINADALLALERRGVNVFPNASGLLIIQDKLRQKQALIQNNVPVPEFAEAESSAAAVTLGERWGWPLILKSRFGGYDGKGNAAVSSAEQAEAAFASLGGASVMAEKWVHFDMEVSILACRSREGDIVTYPVGQNIHRENILRRSIVPAPISAAASAKAVAVAEDVMRVFGGVGMFCVELFVTGDDILVNEVAPRPHNSGHYTIESCVTSQFANHIRAIAGLPLGSPDMIVKAAVMENILGPDEPKNPAILHGAEKALAVPGVALHVYGKENSARNRKMGHLTAVGKSVAEAEALAAEAMKYLHY